MNRFTNERVTELRAAEKEMHEGVEIPYRDLRDLVMLHKDRVDAFDEWLKSAPVNPAPVVCKPVSPQACRATFDEDTLSMTVTPPGLLTSEGNDIEVVADYWGIIPKLQILCYAVNSTEPAVCVRYDDLGYVVEVATDLPVVDPNKPTNWDSGRYGK